MSEIEIFQAEAALPYLLDEIEGADQIVVSFPGYRSRRADPALWQRESLGERKAHRLLIGADEHATWGPAQELRGLRTAVRLMEETTADLGVSPARVACIGTSNAGTHAALAGLAYGAGAMILGGPPLAMGTLLDRWATHERRTGGKPMNSAIRLLALAQREGGPDPVPWLDDLIPSLAAACPSPSRMRLLASPDDFVFPGISQFLEQQDSFPNVHVELELSDAPKHDDVAKDFYKNFLPRVLSEELGAA